MSSADEFATSERFLGLLFKNRQILSQQGATKVLKYDNGADDELVLKTGYRGFPSEAAALRLIEQHTEIPVPKVIEVYFNKDRRQMTMSYMPGVVLRDRWDSLDDSAKEHLCHQSWSIIAKLRQTPKPTELKHHFLCLADGSYSRDCLVSVEPDEQPRPLLDDDAVRARIYEIYCAHNGRKYAKELPDMLPRSTSSVFTHGDIAPRNLLIDEGSLTITGVVDWELAGWYPNYWEYSHIIKPSGDDDWQTMDVYHSTKNMGS